MRKISVFSSTYWVNFSSFPRGLKHRRVTQQHVRLTTRNLVIRMNHNVYVKETPDRLSTPSDTSDPRPLTCPFYP